MNAVPTTYRDLDPYFWRDYPLFAARARPTTARALLGTYRKAGSDRERRLFGLMIFEEVMLATEDLYMVYAAFRDRGERPPLETLLTRNLNEKVEKKINAELASYDAAGDQAIWAALDLPDPADGAALRRAFPDPNTDLRFVKQYLKALPGALHNAHANRVVAVGGQDRVLVKLLNKLKHGFVAVEDPSAWPGAPQGTIGPQAPPSPSPLTATVLTEGTTVLPEGTVQRTVDRWDVRVDAAAVDAYGKTVGAYARTADVIAFLCREVRAPGAAASSLPPAGA
jgi:hypothetical protein